MNIEELRNYCITKRCVEECFPFDETTLVFKVMNKMFALVDLDNPELSINLKAEPGKAIEMREHFSSVLPGYHMNKKHWNTILIDGSIPDNTIYQWIDDSYRLIVDNLPQKIKENFLKIIS